LLLLSKRVFVWVYFANVRGPAHASWITFRVEPKRTFFPQQFNFSHFFFSMLSKKKSMQQHTREAIKSTLLFALFYATRSVGTVAPIIRVCSRKWLETVGGGHQVSLYPMSSWPIPTHIFLCSHPPNCLMLATCNSYHDECYRR
jgi:hypothetical protein